MTVRFAKPEINVGKGSLKEIGSIIKSGWFCEGKYVSALEDHFKEKFKVKYAVACSSATQGLVVAFKAAGIKNMKVGVPAFTWPSTLYALECNNNIPMFMDIDFEDWTMKCGYSDDYFDAYIPVDTFGAYSFIDTIKPVIYDAAHSYNTEDIGSRGIAEVVSLSFTKPVTAMQGGVLLTNDEDIYFKSKELVRLSCKLCEINAYVCLKSIDQFIERERTKNNLIDLYKSLIEVPYKTQENKSPSTFCILLQTQEKRDRIVELFKKNEIEVKVYYEPLSTGLRNTDEIFSKIIALPTYEDIYKSIHLITSIINEA